jgi:hypothetical protein
MEKNGEVKNFEARMFRKDGSIYWALYSARIHPDKGYIEGLVEDITERKKLEEEREKLICNSDTIDVWGWGGEAVWGAKSFCRAEHERGL